MIIFKNVRNEIITDPFKHIGGQIVFEARGVFDGASIQVDYRHDGLAFRPVDNLLFTDEDDIQAFFAQGSEYRARIITPGIGTLLTLSAR